MRSIFRRSKRFVCLAKSMQVNAPFSSSASFDPVANKNSTRWQNWARVESCQPDYLHRPAKETEVAQVIQFARSTQTSVKVVGSGHSPSDIATTRHHMIDLCNMNKVVGTDDKNKRITVQAGMLLSELNDCLHSKGWALSSLGSISDQTVAGALATGTHGTGVKFGVLNTLVRSFRLIDGSGSCLDCSDEQHADIFRTGALSLGVLGVITQVELQCEERFNLKEVRSRIHFDQVVAGIKDLSLPSRSEHTRVWWYPHTDTATICEINRSSEPVTPPPSFLAAAWDRLFFYHTLEAMLRVSLHFPKLNLAINRLYAFMCSKMHSEVGRSDAIFNFECLFTQYVNEWAIPIAKGGEALLKLRSAIEKNKLLVHFPVEIRFTKADAVSLSPSFNRDSCYIGVIMYRPHGQPVDYQRYFALYEQIMAELDGRPHWAKAFQMDRSTLKCRYPEWDHFEKLRKRLDPDNIFANDYTRRVFGL